MNIEVLKRVLKEAQRDERHNNNAETRYWCSQYKAIAEKAIAALAAQQEPWPDEPKGHMAGGVQLSGTSKSKAITELYALFGAPHNADINLTGLNRLLDELIASPPAQPMHPEIKKMYEDYFDKCFRESSTAQRTWVGLTDEEKQEWIDAMPYDPQPRHCMTLVNIIEAKLKEKNNG